MAKIIDDKAKVKNQYIQLYLAPWVRKLVDPNYFNISLPVARVGVAKKGKQKAAGLSRECSALTFKRQREVKGNNEGSPQHNVSSYPQLF